MAKKKPRKLLALPKLEYDESFDEEINDKLLKIESTIRGQKDSKNYDKIAQEVGNIKSSRRKYNKNYKIPFNL